MPLNPVPGPIGLYDPEFERDACGVGFVANLDGRRSHRIVELALQGLVNLTHRGAIDIDAKTGDGAGLLTQIPAKLFAKELAKLGARVERPEDLGVGMVFLPLEDEVAREKCRLIVEEALRHHELVLFGWREVPVDPTVIGDKAEQARPRIEQVLFGRPESMGADEFERAIFLCRKVVEGSILHRGIPDFYVCSMSSRTIVYKGMFVAPQLPAFYLDLKSKDFESAFAVLHQRYSTNTFPQWRLAHPYRMLCHNGEINTLAGNRNWMRAREAEMASPVWGRRAKLLHPVIQPGGSDSAMLDNTLEAIVHGGRSVLHGIRMLMPEAWEQNAELSGELRSFYKYHSCVVEPWDGPAAIVFSDGRYVGATLDRNGLRPARYKITRDGMIVFGSEAGILQLHDSEVVEKGRLGPGRMIAVDTKRGTLLRDADIKRQLASAQPWGAWLAQHMVEYTAKAQESPAAEADPHEVLRRQKALGYTFEDLNRVLHPMIKTGKEAVGSMGDDTPLAVLSALQRPLHHYFKQRFAQVTNPPIDPIREASAMSLFVNLGRGRSLLEESEEHAAMLRLPSPLMTPGMFAWLGALDRADLRVGRVDALWNPSGGAKGLQDGLDRLCRDAERQIDWGCSILVISDRAADDAMAPIPALLATGALHHHLIRVGRRSRASIVVESGEVRDTHLFAALLGYGASAVYPHLVFSEIAVLARTPGLLDGIDAAKAARNAAKAFEDGLLKIMSKMGISTLSSYIGAQVFEAIGLAAPLAEMAFAGTPSRLGGIGLAEVAAAYRAFHEYAHSSPADERLPNQGHYTFRAKGEFHAYNPASVKALHRAVRENARDAYDEFVELSNKRAAVNLRDLLYIESDREPIDIEDVEPAESILKRFATAAMSHGSLSRESHEDLAIAMNRIGGKSNSGEGGEDPRRFHPFENGDLANSAIKQVASARFGVTPEYLSRAKVLEIKMAQGSKPGEGGQLPGAKVSPEIAAIRHSTPGVTLISPPPHHDIYSIEDLAQLIGDLKAVNSRARICVKLVAEAGVGTIAVGVAKAAADVIHISGHDGGTGASPLSSIKHAGAPWEMGLAETHQVLVLNGMRGHVTLRTDGGLRSARDVMVAALLGAEEYVFGTAALVSLGCVMARQCHNNTCPAGIATQREDLRAKYPGKPEHLARFMAFLAQELRELMATLGYETLNELIGRVDLLKQKPAEAVPAAHRLDLSALLARVDPERKRAQRRTKARNVSAFAHQVIDDTLIQDASEVLRTRKGHALLRAEVTNSDRAVGARLAGEIAFMHGDAGLGDAEVEVHFSGTAGQSFGAFCLPGLRFRLEGEANDYVGKSMAGGEIAILPPADAAFRVEENVIVGNTTLYGATGGELYVRGQAGERFAVRNSGAKAVVEGVGDHGCEYMTGGIVVVLGPTGRNFAAGMTGGLAFVHDADGRFADRCNPETVAIAPVDEAGAHTLRVMLEAHAERTDSAVARAVLESWEASLPKFRMLVPHEIAAQRARGDSQPGEVAAAGRP